MCATAIRISFSANGLFQQDEQPRAASTHSTPSRGSGRGPTRPRVHTNCDKSPGTGHICGMFRPDKSPRGPASIFQRGRRHCQLKDEPFGSIIHGHVCSQRLCNDLLYQARAKPFALRWLHRRPSCFPPFNDELALIAFALESSSHGETSTGVAECTIFRRVGRKFMDGQCQNLSCSWPRVNRRDCDSHVCSVGDLVLTKFR